MFYNKKNKRNHSLIVCRWKKQGHTWKKSQEFPKRNFLSSLIPTSEEGTETTHEWEQAGDQGPSTVQSRPGWCLTASGQVWGTDGGGIHWLFQTRWGDDQGLRWNQQDRQDWKRQEKDIPNPTRTEPGSPGRPGASKDSWRPAWW